MSNVNLAPKSDIETQDFLKIYEARYGDYLDVYTGCSAKKRINESVNMYELVALGQQLDQFQRYRKFCETSNKLGNLGAIPQIALDVITAAQAASILPLLASTQPMTEESGIVYYRNVHTMQAGGGYKKGDYLFGPLGLDNPGDGTLGSNRKLITAAQTAAGTQDYQGNIPDLPLRPYRVEINIVLTTGTLFGRDNGEGKILGFGLDGEIDYETGAWSIHFNKDPNEVADIKMMYDVDVDAMRTLDTIQATLQTKPIKASIWALKSDIGAFANYAFNTRFGANANQEVAQDLTDEITRVMNAAAVMEIVRNMPLTNVVEWDVNAPAGVSYAEHKLTFIDAFAAASAALHQQCGAVVPNRMIVGSKAAATLMGLGQPDFVIDPDASTGVTIGVFGTYQGIPVIRAANVIPDDYIVLISNSGNYFNAPLAYAPFMPLMITDTVQSVDNPFRGSQAAGVWAGLTSVNPGAATLIKIKR